MEELLPLAHHAQVAIVHDSYFDGNAVGLQGGQFLNVHLDAAIASNYPDGGIRQTHFDAHSRRKSEAHGAKSTRSNVAIVTGPEIMAGCPHLVLSNVGDDDGLSTRFGANCIQDADGIGIFLVSFYAGKTLIIVGLPGAYFTDPRAVLARL